jgi:hypothetical protein
MDLRFGITLLYGGYDDDPGTPLYSSSVLNLGHGKSGHSPQASKPFRFTQQVMNEHEGCLSEKSGPPQPGHLEGPNV